MFKELLLVLLMASLLVGGYYLLDSFSSVEGTVTGLAVQGEESGNLLTGGAVTGNEREEVAKDVQEAAGASAKMDVRLQIVEP